MDWLERTALLLRLGIARRSGPEDLPCCLCDREVATFIRYAQQQESDTFILAPQIADFFSVDLESARDALVRYLLPRTES
ncbi:MAG: hypothetical protein KDE28_24175 [Anaerolineales bacterium]|nr:hypothetical protein [Anaerolineales bacterium]MCB8959141.1 hypothetical protein [Ardenticatenales bacterium]